MQLTIDGVITPFYPDATSMIVFHTTLGQHYVTLTAEVSALRELLFSVAVLSALFFTVAFGVQIVFAFRAKISPDLQVQPQQGD